MVFSTFVTKVMVAGSLLIPAAVDRSVSWPLPERGLAVPAEQKDALVRPLVSTATECIARTVSADPRYATARASAEFNALIVESVPRCVDDLRSMIDAYDRIYGEGAGETFFMGRYLDELPAAVTTRVKDVR